MPLSRQQLQAIDDALRRDMQAWVDTRNATKHVRQGREKIRKA